MTDSPAATFAALVNRRSAVVRRAEPADLPRRAAAPPEGRESAISSAS
jgi:hypothetical protein